MSWLDDVQDCIGECVQLKGDQLTFTKKGSVTLRDTACGAEQTVKLTEVYYMYSVGVVHNLILYGLLDKKSYTLDRMSGRRGVVERSNGRVAFDVLLNEMY